MKIIVHSHYAYFTDYLPVQGEKYIDCYNDVFVSRETIRPNSFALMIEPRSIEPRGYEYLLKNENWRQFAYIFTHDSELLKLPNAKFISNFGVWGWSDVPKTKNVSFISSWKEMCPLHKERRVLALEYDAEKDNDVDCFGSYKNPYGWADTYEAHAEYRFAIVIENYIDDYWFTEKICNCFANKTVPIYYGARKIDEFFNPQGIIKVDSVQEIRERVNILRNFGFENVYESCLPAIEDNFKRVAKYEKMETYLIKEYGGLLDDLYSKA